MLIKTIYSTVGAFAALKTDGTLVTWGHSRCGGDSDEVKHLLNNVTQVCASECAFAVIKDDGSALSWGQIGMVPSALSSGVQSIERYGFCRFRAIKHDGSEVIW